MEVNNQMYSDSGFPALNSYTKILQVTRDAFGTGRTKKLSFRERQLKNLLRLFEENGEKVLQALFKDLRKSRTEATVFELEVCKAEIKHMIKNLRKYSADDKLPFNWLAILERSYIQVSSESARTLAQLLPQYIDPECYPVILADAEQTKSLLENKFDYIFYTGSSSVGSSILQSAVPYLTPVTLELGGKSPCYIDDNVDFRKVASRIMWGKLTNMGQTCISPDYLLCSERAQRAFITTLGPILKDWYGIGSLQKKPVLARIINHRHFLRLKRLLETTRGSIVFGGQADEHDLWIEPTIVTNVKADDPLLEEEIFGPILPIVTVNSADEAINFILSKPKPLTLYAFSTNNKTIEKIVSSTSSGGCCINDVLLQNGLRGLPFGGVGASGMGCYHGKFSFDTFSHKRGILVRGLSYASEKLGEVRYPPPSKGKLALVNFVLHCYETFDVKYTLKGTFTHFLALILGAAILILLLYLGYNPIERNCEAPALQYPKSSINLPLKLLEAINPDQFIRTE
ncbi:unnamed protein product [Allacma fusca]|uniref:Aldehyde dehydrogenase n=1 Tax=Allacma fusca TaxID=39272 RepID=A0A8J2PUD3_9HEXA|nr:unnamed protein product [Allacma fusca]